MSGCKSTRAIKKLSNHLTQVHNIRDAQKRRQLLHLAKSAGQQLPKRMKVNISIKEALQQSSTTSSFLIKPNLAPTRGSTKHLPRFDIDAEPLLLDFIDNLISFDGGAHSLTEAKQIAIDISKFMAFADPTRAKWSGLINVDKMKDYIQKLTTDGIGPDGLTTKTNRLTLAVKYGIRVKLLDSIAAREAIDRFSAWKTTLKGQKRRRALQRAVEEGTSNDADILSKVEQVLECKELLVSTCKIFL